MEFKRFITVIQNANEFARQTTEGSIANTNDSVLKKTKQVNQIKLKETEQRNEALLKQTEQTYFTIALLNIMNFK